MRAPDATPTTDVLVDEALSLAGGLNRPLRYVQINTVPSGSTGAVMRRIAEERRAAGDDCWTMWGRGRAAEDDWEFNFGSKVGTYVDALLARLDDRAGFHSKAATRRLLAKLGEIDPDVVHLHNLHGYYVNVEMLFGWLASHRCQVMWTLHDCWAFTGHCVHFQYIGCDRWKTGCRDCPQKSAYPASRLMDSSKRNWEDKRGIFTSLPLERMTLVTPSRWLKGLVGESFLKGYTVEVQHNTVDATVFRPTPSDFRERHRIGNRFMVLGVASPWTESKGLADFVRLAGEFDAEKCAIVLVGLSKKQIREMPEGIVGLARTDSPRELAGIYSAADVFFNPTLEDNYPTVNLEAEACGTPVVTYDTGGCSETIRHGDSCVVACYEGAVRKLRERLTL